MENISEYEAFESSKGNVEKFLRYIENKKKEIKSKGASAGAGEQILDLLFKGASIGGSSPSSSNSSSMKSYSPLDTELQKKISPVSGTLDTSKANVSGDKKKNIEKIISALNKYGIVNPLTQKAILSVIGKESNYIPKTERSYKNTDNDRIRKYFGKRVAGYSEDELTKLKKSGDAFWNVVYGGRYGNNEENDGADYRGRGFNQITFKGSYEKYRDLLRKNGTNVDIVRNPEMLNDIDVAAEVNALFFLNRLNSRHSKRKFGNDDPNDFTTFEKALGAAVNSNAGWGKDILGSRSYRNALAYSNALNIEDLKKTV